MGGPTNPAAGWYPDPAGSGRQRYFDGVQWTERYAQTFTTVYEAPVPVDTTPKAAGWYPDPRGGAQRRYWDGEQWTDAVAEPEIVIPPTPRAGLVFLGGIVTLLVVSAAVQSVKEGNAEALWVLLPLLGVGALLGWGIRLAFRSDARRKQRQQERDRNRALAINAEKEDRAYIEGDDLRGVYAQFRPPPEVLDDDR